MSRLYSETEWEIGHIFLFVFLPKIPEERKVNIQIDNDSELMNEKIKHHCSYIISKV